ncbi:Ig-like domain repeat protein, partial [Candidatus Woesearchaeota archaeon]|nr:Ig-like domain repeat protein [Candidatus Woesearchaeota archaeon]
MRNTNKKKLVRSRVVYKKRTLFIAILIIILFISVVVLLQNANILYGRAGTTTIPVTACGVLDQEGRTYELQQDIFVTGGNCITINAQNILFNGNNHQIYCTGATSACGTGISIQSITSQGASIQSVKVLNYDIGVSVAHTKNINFFNVNASSGSQNYNMYVNNVSNLGVYGSYFSILNGRNINVASSTDFSIIGTQMVAGGTGHPLQITASNNTIILDSSFNQSSNYGGSIYLDSIKKIVISGSNISGGYGIQGSNIINFSLTGNTIKSTGPTMQLELLKFSKINYNNITAGPLLNNQAIQLYPISHNNSFTGNSINILGTGKPFNIYNNENVANNKFLSNVFYKDGILSPNILLTETGTEYPDPPAVNLESGGTITILDAELKDAILSGSKTITAYVNGLAFETSTSDNIHYSFGNVFPEGSYTWYVEINDSYGNIERTTSKNFDIKIVTTCGTLYGNITLRNNIETLGNCFIIGADDVTIDGNGYTIQGDGIGYAISNYNSGGVVYGNNVIIKNFASMPNNPNNGGIFNFEKAILLVNVNNTRIYNNVIGPTNAFNGIGIDIGGSGNINVSSNELLSLPKIGVKFSFMRPSVSTIQQNTININGEGGGGIIIEDSENYPYQVGTATLFPVVNIINNVVSTLDDNSPAIILNTTPNIVMKGNVLTTTGKNSPGILVPPASYLNRFVGDVQSSNDTIQTSGISSSVIEQNSLQGEYIRYMYLINDSLKSESSPSININGNYVRVINTVLDKNNILTSNTGIVEVSWYLRARVFNGTEPVRDSVIYFYDMNNAISATAITDVMGYTSIKNIKEFIQTAAGKTYYSPYTFNATKPYKFFQNITTAHVSEPNMQINISLVPDTPAKITLNNPENYSTIPAFANFSFTINDDSPLDSVKTRTKLFIDDNIKASRFDISNGTANFFVNLYADISEGPHSWRIQHTDTAENTVDSQTRVFNLDKKSPNVTVISPKNQEYYSGNIMLNASITDATGVSSAWANISFFSTAQIMPVLKKIILQRVDNNTFTGTIDSGTLQDGRYEFKFFANDTVNNLELWGARVILNIDNSYPVINTFSAPENNTVINNKQFYSSILIKELNPSNCTLIINGKINSSVDLSTNFIDPANPLSQCFFLASNLADGTYFYNVTVYDLAGNFAVSETRKITIDTAPPVIDLGLADNTKPVQSTKILHFSAMITDAGGAVDTVLIGSGTTMKKMILTNLGVYTIDSSLSSLGCMTQGSCSLTIKVNDTARNTINSGPIMFIIDDVAPGILPLSPERNKYYNKQFPITVLTESSYNVSYLYSGTQTITSPIALTSDSTKTIWNTTTPPTLPPDGVYSYTIIAVDEAENENRYPYGYIYIDTTPPNITVHSPIQQYYKNDLLINATADDGINLGYNGVYNVAYQISSSPFAVSPPAELTRGNNNNWYKILPLPDGSYSIIVSVYDYARNVKTETINNVLVDKTPPSNINFAAQTAQNNSLIPQGAFTVNVSFIETNPDSCVMTTKNNAGFETNYQMTIKGNNCDATISSIGDGTYSFFVTLTDKVGFTGVSGQRFVTIDTTAPVVTLQNPTNGALITTSSVRYTVATDEEESAYPTLANITFYVDGILIKTLIADGSGEYYYDQTGIPDGQHSWHVVATDIFRRSTTTPTTSFTINTDATPPNVTILGPSKNSWHKDNVPIEVLVVDDGIINSVQYRYEKGLLVSGWTALTNILGVWKGVLGITGLSGEFTIRINATDNVKHSNINNYTIINIDSKPPKDIVFLEPQPRQKSTVVRFIAKFNETNPEVCEININGTNAGLNIQGMSCNGQMTRNDGLYSYNVTITDKAGNKAASIQKTLLIDSTPPELIITGKQPTTAQKSKSQLLITATAKDLTTSIDKVIAKTTISQSFIEKSPGVYEIVTTPESIGCVESVCNVNIIANDTLGNINTTLVQVIIDDTPPQGRIATPMSGYYNSQQSITATSSEQLQKAEYRVEGIIISDWKNMSITGTATGSTVTAPMQLSDGTYSVRVKFVDVAGNENNITVQNLVMDLQKPNVALLAPLQNSNTTNKEVNFIIHSEDDNLKEVVLYVNGALKGAKSGLSGDYNFSINLNTGIYTWYVTAFDNANNIETSESRTFTIIQQEQMPAITSVGCGRITNSTTLTNNLLSNGTCLTIGAPNIIIDGSGYSITGDGRGIGIDNSDGYDNITITNIKVNNYATGINIKDSEKSRITSVIINNSFENSQGISVTSSNNSTISNSIITMLGNTSTSMLIQNSEATKIIDNTLSTKGSISYALQFVNSSNSLSNNNIITTSGEYSAGVFLQSGEDIQMVNGAILSEKSQPVLTENATATLKNITFNKKILPFVQGGSGKITIQWNILVKTTSSGNNLEGVYIIVNNVIGEKEVDGTTSNEGLLIALTEEVVNRTLINYKTPHTITATKKGHKESRASINLKETNSTTIILDLEKEQEKIPGVSGGGTTQTNQSNASQKNETPVVPIKESPAVIVPTIFTTGTKVLSGINEKDNPVTCAEVAKKTTSDAITLLPTKIQAKIPRGYEKIKESFNINCDGETVKFTTAIPDTYKDVRLYSCIEGVCTIEYGIDSGELSCGEKKILEL